MTAMDEKEELCRKLFLNCRNELYSLYPFLDGAFASLPGKQDSRIRLLGTEGKFLYFQPDGLISLYGKNPKAVLRGYVHVLLHCLYLHPFRRGNRDRRLWNLACDLSVDQILRKEEPLGQGAEETEPQKHCREILGELPLSADQIYVLLEEDRFPYPLSRMEEAFAFDDHSFWDRAGKAEQQLWEQVLSYTGRMKQGNKHRGSRSGDRSEVLEDLSRGSMDYRGYLRQFAVPREEMELDMDSFDYIYYNLGLERYGNLPLIEPPEVKEGHKLSQLVIAIDTSGSCDRETVRNFLNETYGILSDRENFFRKMEVYLLQCDCMIQSAVVIHSQEEWKNYSREITVAGRGGTDFTPVFRYVEDQRSLGKLRQLKALLYFTDGDGCYPREKPSYETAFVFLKPNEHMQFVPDWAKKLVVGERI